MQAVQRKDVVVPCVSNVDCNGLRSIADTDSKGGCMSECLDGWSGNDCSVEPQEATTTIDSGKAIIDGNHFDLYTSEKHTLLSLLRHASGSEAESNMNDFEYQLCRDTKAEKQTPGNCIQASDVVDAKDFIVTTSAEIEARENGIQAVDKCVAEAVEQCKKEKREEVNVFQWQQGQPVR